LKSILFHFFFAINITIILEDNNMAYKFQLGSAVLSGSINVANGAISGSAVSDTLAASIVSEIDNGEIPIAKLAATAVTVTAGDGLSGGGSVTLGNSVSLAVGVDDSSIETNSDVLRVKASGVTNAMLAGSIANAKLANSTISGVALGTNLSDLTVDDSSIQLNSGTTFNGSAARTISVKAGGVTNAMLAGSIANAKLANSGVTIGSTSVSLGATQTTFAGINHLTASNIRVDNLDVVTINSVNQTETTLEIADKKIVAGLSGSSENGYAYQFGGGAADNGLAAMKYFDGGGGAVGIKFAIGDNDQLIVRNNLFIPENNNVVSLGSDSNRWSALHTTAITLGGTAITSTAAELNILDGVNTTLAAGEINLLDNSTAIGAAVSDLADTDGIIVEDGDTMKKVQLSSIKTYIGNTSNLDVEERDNNESLTVGVNYFANLGGAEACALPATPQVGDAVYVKAPANCSSTNTLTIANDTSSHRIDGEEQIVLESPHAAVMLVYVVADQWKVF
tara:strand:+ start:976 stop:2499 length:1524 start_codon:yes stop_codon:yes gene_type:complete